MKFKVDSKAHGDAIKKELYDGGGFLSLASIMQAFGDIDLIAEEDWDHGWFLKDLKDGNKLRVRECKDGWYIYFPDDMVPAPEELVNPSNEMTEVEFINYLIESVRDLLIDIYDSRRKCMVNKSAGRGKIKYYNCWFHCWTMNRVQKDDGTIVDQLLAVCEFPNGHVERIDFKNMVFVEEWE